PVYRATENGVPAALPMMTIWRTASAADNRFYVIDTSNRQIFLLANMGEGGANRTLLFARLHWAGTGFDEVELYEDRSRSDGGFQFDAAALGHLPPAWTDRIAPARLPSRAQLLRAGQSIFDTAIDGPPPAPACRMMENGKPVAEDPKVLEVVGVGSQPLPANADGSVPVPCGAPPIRPTDANARTLVVDEEQGIVVSIATVQGLVQPYLITDPTTSAFVPHSLGQPYFDLLAAQRKTGRYGHRPEIAPMPASIAVAQMHRYYDGQLQGMHLLEKLGPPDARSAWTAAPAPAPTKGAATHD
ncbi:MAG TPA: hypothetical protein VFF94_13620, partial [Novosphingobium sp.]|nr:hypothetical protein [Novosphingobium sp.]